MAHSCKSPTLALFVAVQEGRISHNDYLMLLKWRCQVVASERKHDGQRAEATGKNKGA